jgi:3-methyladenine DNA glycosylase AlkD
MSASKAIDTLRRLRALSARGPNKADEKAASSDGADNQADVRRLAEQIGVDQSLAVDLWASGEPEARTLALLIADPKRMPRRTLDDWITQIGSRAEGESLASFVSNTPHALDAIATWTAGASDLEVSIGWSTLAHLARSEEAIHDDLFVAYLAAMEMEMPASPVSPRQAMNEALIAIGCRNENLRNVSLASAAKIRGRSDASGQSVPEAAGSILGIWAKRATSPNGHLPGDSR